MKSTIKDLAAAATITAGLLLCMLAYFDCLIK
jgi:hypothetical protein